MGIFKTLGSFALQLLALISVFIIISYAIFIIFVDPETIGVNNVGDQLALDIVKSEDLTEEELVKKLLSEYQVEEEVAKRDVAKFVEKLKEAKLIEI